jgi:hypothetical protein
MDTVKKTKTKRKPGRPKGYKPNGVGEWTPVFLAALQQLPNVRAACQKSGVSRSEAYRLRAQDSTFSQAWHEALQDGIDIIEATLMARAMKRDTVAGIFLLKNLRPEVYGENVNVNVSGTLSIEEVRQARASLNAKLTQIIDVVAPGDRRLLTTE